MRCHLNITVLLIGLNFLFGSCQKQNSVSDKDPVTTSGLFHIDNVFNDINMRVLLFSKSVDSDSEFNVISKTNNALIRLTSVSSKIEDKIDLTYIPNSEADSFGNITGAVMDKNGGFWVTGTKFFRNALNPYIIKLDKKGTVVFSKSFSNPIRSYENENLVSCKLQVLSNNDIVLLIGERYNQHVDLIRISNDGVVKWSKKYAIKKLNISGSSYVGNNNTIIETNNGDIVFLSKVDGDANLTGLLTCCAADGELKYSKRYDFNFDDFHPNLKLSKQGDVLWFGNPFYGSSPYTMKIDPNNGTVKAAKSTQGVMRFPTFQDIVDTDNGFKLLFSIDSETDLIDVNSNFDVIKSAKIFAANSTRSDNARFIYDAKQQQYFCLMNETGPFGGTGFQFINVNSDGKSCQVYNREPVKLEWSRFVPKISAVNMIATNITFTEAPISWKSYRNNFNVVDACGM